MKPGIIYAVFSGQKEMAIGHFLDGKYFEPFGSDRQLGHLEDDNFVYYMKTPENPVPKVQGQVVGNVLIRERDGHRFQIEPA